MDYLGHARLSARKFGGQPSDYLDIHRFIDSGKLFRMHLKHRLLLHSTFGAELAIEIFGDYLENSDGRIALVRDVVHAHCREDLGGRVPSLLEWIDGTSIDGFEVSDLPQIADDEELHEFMYRPFRRTGLPVSLAMTFSDFGIFLVEQRFGARRAEWLASEIGPLRSINALLDAVTFDQDWQYSPRRQELQWLATADI